MKKLLIILSVFLVGCNPCKYVSKHLECFPSDTVREYVDVIRVEKEYITNDSIVFDTLYKDVLKTIEKTVYRTKFKTITDSIIMYKDVAKVNPINTELEKTNKEYSIKVETLKNIRNYLIIALISLVVVLMVLIKFR